MIRMKRHTNRGFSISNSDMTPISNTTTETALFSEIIPAGALGTNKTLEYRFVCMLQTPLLSVPTISIKVRFGTFILDVVGGLGLAVNLSTDRPFMIAGSLANMGEFNKQFVYAQTTQYTANTPLLMATGAAINGADSTINTDLDQNFSVTIQFGGLSIGTIFTPKIVSIDIS